ncbi:D-psicose/D-tagatose/L-ribulose 3-epimerase [Xaviernesmea oryzae]|uniref:D-psicose/D-tagatose/L-ribulose 3-epimerase n=1 Tax=Xaviernesmea oryzae TaxID=464029 RepID=A0A1X7DXH1_9HYPH|nr:sugar phosphate isomerase/epimerase family protein [Xaviernesmea oryzae]SMF23494.1 D-psicose/D-tagatose/L-ribulose 3-epimerase [Xaviernesmea oryzae]
MNPIGLISIQFVRPFTRENFSVFSRMKSLGFDFVELLVPEKGELDLAETRKALEDAGLGIVLAARVNLSRDIASSRHEAHRGGIEYLKYCVDCASELGATIVGGPLTGSPLVYAARAPEPVAEDERIARKDRCVAALKEAGDTAADNGVQLAIEPLNRFESDVLCTCAQAIDLLDAVDHPSVNMMLDTFHMHMEEASMPESIRRAGKRLVHFQANENHRGFPGTGATDWTAIGRALVDIGYTGPMSMEPFRRNDDRFGVPIAQWRAPHEDETAKLTAACNFLHSTMLLAEHRR